MKTYLMRTNNSLANHFDFMSDVFDGFFKPVFFDEKLDGMKTDITETEKDYQMEIEMPGFEKSDISISLENEYLTVRAEKKEKEESGEKNRYLRKERSVSCERSYFVGDIKEEDVKAKYNNGVLSLVVPKDEPKKALPRNISID